MSEWNLIQTALPWRDTQLEQFGYSRGLRALPPTRFIPFLELRVRVKVRDEVRVRVRGDLRVRVRIKVRVMVRSEVRVRARVKVRGEVS